MANEILNAFKQVWRDYATDGVPSSGAQKPRKAEVRNVGVVIQDQVDALNERVDDVIDLATTGTQPKDAALVVATDDITLSGEQTIDDVTTSASRVLVIGKTSKALNGLYLSGSGAWTRTTDADTAAEIAGMVVYVSAGTANGGKTYRLATTGTITVGTTALSFVLAGDQSEINTDLTNVKNDVELDPAPGAWQAYRDATVDRWTGVNRQGPLAVADAYGEAALGVDEAGTTYLWGARFEGWNPRMDGGSWDIGDELGAVFRLKPDGSVDLNPSQEMLDKLNALYGQAYNADYKVVETGGTSTDGVTLSRGYGLPLSSQDVPVMYGIIGLDQSFLSGVLPGADPGDEPDITPTALDPAGTSYRLGPSVLMDVMDMSAYSGLEAIAGETRQTMASAMCHHLQEKLHAATGDRAQIVVSFASVGGQRYDQIKRGTYAYGAVMTAARRMTEAARAQGKRLVILGIVSPHGPANSNDSVYTVDEMAASLVQLRHDIEGDLAGISGQSEPIRLFKSVPASFVASRPLVWANYYAKAVMRAAVIDPMIVPVAPDYVWPLKLPATDHAGDSIHPGSVGQVMMGATYGEIIWQACFNVGPGALRAQHVYWVSSTELRIQFNQAVAVDTSDVLIKTGDLGTGMGIDLMDGYFGAVGSPTIAGVSSVSVLSGDSRTLRYILSAACTYSSPTLLIAHRRSNGPDYAGTGGVDYTDAHGPKYGPRCAIRSAASFGTSVATLSQAANAMGSAGTTDLYHWACANTFILSKP